MPEQDKSPKGDDLTTADHLETEVEIVEGREQSSAPETGIIRDLMDDQDDEAAKYALDFLKTVLRLRGVRIDREQFLVTELRKRGIGESVIAQAVASTPAEAGILPSMLDEVAEAAIGFETKKSTALSFAAGLPGGFAMLGSVPADITQFYVHAFRVMQKVAYVYGWQSFLKDAEDIDDETLGKLAAFLGVMMGVGGAAATVKNFALNVARPAIQKQIANKALTKTVWYGPLKQTLKMIGVKLTKDSFAKTVTKAVPVMGGVVSGGLTFVTLDNQSKRLMRHLREIPPPGVDAEVYLAAVHQADEADPQRTRSVGDAAKDAVPDRAQEALSTASNKVKGVAGGTARRVGSLLRRSKPTAGNEPDGRSDPAQG